MNQDMTTEAAGTLMEQVRHTLLSQQVWPTAPLGHTEMQLRRFVLNDREFPAGLGKFRQAIRELWARQEAYYQVHDRLEDLAVQEQRARATLAQARASWAFLPWSRMRRAATMLEAQQLLARIDRARLFLQVDMRERIMRETVVLLDEARKNAPPDAQSIFSQEDEMKLWQHRAKHEPKVAELMDGGR